jgi:hypothetical protein
VWRVTVSPRGDAIVAITDGAGVRWRMPSFRGRLDELGRVTRCRSAWRVRAHGLELDRTDPSACRPGLH